MMAQSRAESTRDTYNYGQYINQFPPNTIKVIREFERIQKKICRHKMSIMFNEICIYIYIYIHTQGLWNRCIFLFKKSKINSFFTIFFHECKLSVVWNWFVPKISLIPQKYLFCNHLKSWPIKQNAPGLNRGLSSNFYWLRSANHMKFPEECVICIEACFSQKMFTNRIIMDLPGSKRQSMKWKHINSQVKKSSWHSLW